MIETKRLILRKFENTFADIDSLYEILSDEKVNTYLPWWPAKTISDAQRFYDERISDSKYFYAICLKTPQLPIGYIDLSEDSAHDFGYGLKEDFWNKGIATEAGQAMIEFLKTEGIPYLTATHDRENVGSGKVMQKLGMKYEYSYQEQWQPKDIPVIFRMYQLNLETQPDYVYRRYWNKYEKHFVEDVS